MSDYISRCVSADVIICLYMHWSKVILSAQLKQITLISNTILAESQKKNMYAPLPFLT